MIYKNLICFIGVFYCIYLYGIMKCSLCYNPHFNKYKHLSYYKTLCKCYQQKLHYWILQQSHFNEDIIKIITQYGVYKNPTQFSLQILDGTILAHKVARKAILNNIYGNISLFPYSIKADRMNL